MVEAAQGVPQSRERSLAMPYLLICAVFSRDRSGRLMLSGRNEAYFRTQPLRSPDDELSFTGAFTEGLVDLEGRFTIPLNRFDTTFSARARATQSEIVEAPFDHLSGRIHDRHGILVVEQLQVVIDPGRVFLDQPEGVQERTWKADAADRKIGKSAGGLGPVQSLCWHLHFAHGVMFGSSGH